MFILKKGKASVVWRDLLKKRVGFCGMERSMPVIFIYFIIKNVDKLAWLWIFLRNK